MNKNQTSQYCRDAQRSYSYMLPCHNWDHAQAVMHDVDILADRAKSRGLIVALFALQVAAAWHDAGFHEDHIALGFPTKEHYSAQLPSDRLEGEDVGDEEKAIMDQAILCTIHASSRPTTDTLLLHRADVANIGGPYDEFQQISERLWHEQQQLEARVIPWDKFVQGSQKYIHMMIDEARQELPRIGESIGQSGSYDTQASHNAQLLAAHSPSDQ